MKSKKVVAISGGFDPVHVGHVRMIAAAAKMGDVIIIANSDNWLMRKKGYVFMNYDERVKPDIFANGGDRKSDNVPEVALCDKLGIELRWNVGGEKIQSSSELVAKTKNKKEK